MPSCRRARSRHRKPPATTVGADSQSARKANAAAHGPGTYTRRPCVALYATQTQKLFIFPPHLFKPAKTCYNNPIGL